MGSDRNRVMKRWFAISLIVPQTFTEPISNFLVEMGATGIEEREAEFQQVGLKAYFPDEGKANQIHRSLHRYLLSLQKLHSGFPSIDIQSESILERDWSENWKKFFKPLRVGSRWVIKPPWAKVRLKKDDLLIEINPGMAFGTGTHATTQLCLQALEKRLKKRGLSALDIGTGSGILAIAASRLGASEVLGIDIDQVAVDNAKENVIRNGVSESVRIRRARIGDVRKRFDLVIANLDSKTLTRMRKTLIRRLNDRGLLILSGILKVEEEKLRQHYLPTGLLKWIETTQQREWICLTFKKKGS